MLGLFYSKPIRYMPGKARRDLFCLTMLRSSAAQRGTHEAELGIPLHSMQHRHWSARWQDNKWDAREVIHLTILELGPRSEAKQTWGVLRRATLVVSGGTHTPKWPVFA